MVADSGAKQETVAVEVAEEVLKVMSRGASVQACVSDGGWGLRVVRSIREIRSGSEEGEIVILAAIEGGKTGDVILKLSNTVSEFEAVGVVITVSSSIAGRRREIAVAVAGRGREAANSNIAGKRRVIAVAV